MPPVPANDGDNPAESRLADSEVRSPWMSTVSDFYVSVVLGFSWSHGQGRSIGNGRLFGAFKSTVRLRTETRMPLCSQAEFSRLAQCLPGPFARTCRTEEGNLIEIDSLQMPTGVKKVLHELDLDSTGWHQTLVARCPKPGFKKPSVLRSVQ